MFNLKKVVAAGALLAATFAVPFCGAQHLDVLTAGSSAQWGVFALAADALATASGDPVKHCTLSTGTLNDHRGGSVPVENGKLWVVWTEPGSAFGVNSHVWAYLSVDSVVGVRAFQAAPRDTLTFNASSCANLLSASGSVAGVFPEADDTTTFDPGVSNTAANFLNTKALTAANTDIRPEDALFATNRAIGTLDTTSWKGLGLGTNGVVGDGTSTAHVVPFALSGTDPFSGNTVTPFVTIPIGAAPIVFFANNNLTTAGHLGNTGITDIENGRNTAVTSINHALNIFGGTDCSSSELGAGTAQNIIAVLREPTSGTMNTTEYTNFRLKENSFTGSQEMFVSPATSIVGPCQAGGSRLRAVGTGDEVNTVKANTDAIGYAFFSYEALPHTSPANVTANYKYLTLNGVDPINPSYADGEFPTCTSPQIYFCNTQDSLLLGTPAYDQFQNLRTGAYRSWSLYRAVSDSTGAAGMQTLINVAAAVADQALPDFVPLLPVCNGTAFPSGITLTNHNPMVPVSFTTYQSDEPGLWLFRSHFTRDGIAPSNGAQLGSSTPLACTEPDMSTTTLFAEFVGDTAGTPESGGDVGGAIIISGGTVSGGAPNSANPQPAEVADTGKRQ